MDASAKDPPPPLPAPSDTGQDDVSNAKKNPPQAGLKNYFVSGFLEDRYVY